MRVLLLCVVVAGCGGIIDTGDGGTSGVDAGNSVDSGVIKNDASSLPDAIVTPSCTEVQTATSMDSNGGCQASASWSCGTTQYSVQCTCPDATCSCSQQNGNTVSGTDVKAPSFCPKCDATGMPAICGFPTN